MAVQDGAPQELLLGTDVLSHLGVRVEVTPPPSEDASQEAGNLVTELWESSVVVKLLDAVRIPAGFEQPLRATVDGSLDATLALLEPLPGEEPFKAMVVETSLVELNADGSVMMLVQNRGKSPLYLAPGEVLGTLESVEIVPTPSGEKVNSISVDSVANCRLTMEEEKERRKRLCAEVWMDAHNLTLEQRDQLMTLVTYYADVFAMEGEPLGSTQLVQHHIDTAWGPSPYSAVHSTSSPCIESEMIQDMTVKGVIQPSRSPWASPVVLVAKKDGSTHFCVNYR